MDARTQSDSVATDIQGVLTFDLFAIRHSEPFLVMYGISAAFGYQPTVEQLQLIRKTPSNRATFETWKARGAEFKAGTKPFPEWLSRDEVRR